MDPARASTLLERYTATRCGASFRELVEGHAALVYSAALRITGDSGLAEDVMQNVFAALAAKPGAVRDGKGLAAWLHRAASGRAVDAVRTESRRRQREQHATHMNVSTSSGEPDSLWEAAAPVIDSALGSLSATDRELLLLRFWQRQDMRCIGQAFGLSDDAAQKRIGRALQKLRSILQRRGITGTASALSVALMASASAAPPAAAVARISAAALALSQTAPSAAASTILTKTIAMTTKSKVALTTAAACVAVGAPVYYQQHQINELREENASLRATSSVRKTVLSVPAANQPGASASAKTTSAEVASNSTVPKDTGISGRTRNLGNRTFGPNPTSDLETSRLTRLGMREGGTRAAEPATLTESGGLLDLGADEGTRTVPMVAGKVHWDHGQATGAPDTKTAGDFPTAWAPKRPRSGEQWLSLGYDKSVEIKEINIHETHSPGAISKVAAQMPDGSEKILWQGTAAAPNAGEDSLETSLPVPRGTTASQIKVYLDTNRVQSWPEIDAVELVGTNGSRQWASRSSASSSYSENYSPTPVTIGGGSGEQVITQAADGRVLEVRSPASLPAAAPPAASSP